MVLQLDFAIKEQLLFQDPATPIMNGIIELHHTICFYLIVIIMFVLAALISVMGLFMLRQRSVRLETYFPGFARHEQLDIGDFDIRSNGIEPFGNGSSFRVYAMNLMSDPYYLFRNFGSIYPKQTEVFRSLFWLEEHSDTSFQTGFTRQVGWNTNNFFYEKNAVINFYLSNSIAKLLFLNQSRLMVGKRHILTLLASLITLSGKNISLQAGDFNLSLSELILDKCLRAFRNPEPTASYFNSLFNFETDVLKHIGAYTVAHEVAIYTPAYVSRNKERKKLFMKDKESHTLAILLLAEKEASEYELMSILKALLTPFSNFLTLVSSGRFLMRWFDISSREECDEIVTRTEFRNVVSYNLGKQVLILRDTQEEKDDLFHDFFYPYIALVNVISTLSSRLSTLPLLFHHLIHGGRFNFELIRTWFSMSHVEPTGLPIEFITFGSLDFETFINCRKGSAATRYFVNFQFGVAPIELSTTQLSTSFPVKNSMHLYKCLTLKEQLSICRALYNELVTYFLVYINFYSRLILYSNNLGFIIYRRTQGHFNRFVHLRILELIWTIIPTIILIFIAVPSITLLYAIETVSDSVVTVKVIGHQWYWSYQIESYDEPLQIYHQFDSYMVPEEQLHIGRPRLLEVDNPLYLPTRVPMNILITSADVLHSWAVPSMGVKVDAVPGRLNQISVYIERSGIFYGQCSELCGTNHGFMPIKVIACEAPEWMALYCKGKKT